MIENLSAEILSNIQSLSISLTLTQKIPAELCNDISIKILDRRAKILGLVIADNQSGSSMNKIPLLQIPHDISLITSNASIKITSRDCSMPSLTIRVPMAHESQEEELDHDFAIVNTKVLKNLSNISCGCCNTSICRPDSFSKIMDLPSEHWHELLECWICHPDDELKKIANWDMSAKTGNLMVGNGLVVFNAVDAISQSLSRGDLSSDEKSVLCSSCNTPLGLCSLDRNGNVKEYNIYQSVVNFNMKDGSYISVDYLRCFIQDIYEKHRAHGTSKFMVRAPEGKQELLIWVVHWNTKVNIKGHKVLGRGFNKGKFENLYVTIISFNTCSH